MTITEIVRFIQIVLECSVYLAPTKPGLTYAELLEVGVKADLLSGEINDAMKLANCAASSGGRMLPSKQHVL